MKKYKTAIIEGSEYVRTKEIEYKKVEVDDFNSCGYKAEKFMIQLDKNGYLGDTLIKTIKIKDKSTDVLNITTGCGKTTTIYELISKINKEDPKAIIIVATPYLSLVDKDYNALINEHHINKDLITKYTEIKVDLEMEKSSYQPFLDGYIKGRKIHITTINALLRNPGDTAFEQMMIKTNYFTSLYQYCKNNKHKVYLFLDEVHASIHNFKNEYIFFLTMWKDVIQKCIVSTATYTEPVNIVIKHMAYMTDDVINIYETERTKRKVLSPLDMAFFPYKFPKDRINDLSLYINEYLEKNITNSDKQNFHIICYSRKLAEQLSNVIFLDFKEIKQLTSNKKNKFEDGFNHIGTNFSTGVDIKKEGDILIIIFPFKYKDEDVKGEEGIFYDGLPSILQSVARLRSKGRILFIIPPMKAYIKDEMSTELFSKIHIYKKNDDDSVEDSIKEVQEDYLKDEKEILEKFIKRRNKKVKFEQDKYNKIIQAEVLKAKGKEDDINYVKMNRPEIQFPSKDTFILERGQEFIKYNSYKSGKYITPYVVWAALNDQYVNCSLENVYHFIRLNHLITSDQIIHHLKTTMPKNSLNEDFTNYFAHAKKKLTQYDNGEKLLKVKIKEKGSDKVLRTNTVTIFWKIVEYYYSNKTSIPVTSIDHYYKYSVNERRDKIGKLYKQLKSIIHKINENIEGKFIFEKAALSDKNIVQYENDLKEIISSIKENDPVIKALVANKNGFWTIKEDCEYPHTRYLLQTLFDKTIRKNVGSRRYELKAEWQ